ncbi:MAG: hypothetical protein GF344_05745 [Chitinivibrionales bacterium]|nr:hypothetical protein [Chitinivibrionales bacterium]MBD3356470.1 hypothetical protein [Chitinivibrionales bacterium]
MKKLFVSAVLLLITFSAANEPENIVVVVNKSNPVSNISVRNLRRIYLCTKKKWKDGTSILLTAHQEGNPINDRFYNRVIGFDRKRLDGYYSSERMKGRIIAKPIALKGEEFIQDYISRKAGAVGFVEHTAVDTSRVRVIKVNNALPGDKDYPLKEF